jgi:hypothetical protein
MGRGDPPRAHRSYHFRVEDRPVPAGSGHGPARVHPRQRGGPGSSRRHAYGPPAPLGTAARCPRRGGRPVPCDMPGPRYRPGGGRVRGLAGRHPGARRSAVRSGAPGSLPADIRHVALCDGLLPGAALLPGRPVPAAQRYYLDAPVAPPSIYGTWLFALLDAQSDLSGPCRFLATSSSVSVVPPSPARGSASRATAPTAIAGDGLWNSSTRRQRARRHGVAPPSECRLHPPLHH